MNAPALVLRADRIAAVGAVLDEHGIAHHRLSGTNLSGNLITFAHLDEPAEGPAAVEALQALDWTDTRVHDCSGMIVVETHRHHVSAGQSR